MFRLIVGAVMGLKLRNTKVGGVFLIQHLYGLIILILVMTDKDGCPYARYVFIERSSLSFPLKASQTSCSGQQGQKWPCGHAEKC